MLVASAHAQPGWLPAPEGLSVSARATYGFGDDYILTDEVGNEIGQGSASFGLLVLDASVPLGETVHLIGSMPVTYERYPLGLDPSGGGGPETVVDLANPYIGVAAGVAPGAEVEIGAWVPVVEGFGRPLVFNQTERLSFESFEGHGTFDPGEREIRQIGHFSARVAFRGERDIARMVRLRGEITPVLTVLTEDPMMVDPSGEPLDFPRTDLSFTSRVFADVRLGGVALTTGFEGRYEPDSGINTYVDEFLADGLAAVTVESLPVRPSAFVRHPILGRFDTGLSLGVGLSVPVR